MRVRSGRAFEPRRRQTLPLHAKLTQRLGSRLSLSFAPWGRRFRAADGAAALPLKSRSKRRVELMSACAASATGPHAPASERGVPNSERGVLDRDSVLPLEVLAHASLPAPAPEPPQRKTPKPPRPQRVLLETDDDISSIAPPALFAAPMSDAPLVASTAPLATESPLTRAAYRLASIALFGGLGVAAGWTLRGHSEQSARTAPVADVIAARAAAVAPVNAAPANREPTPPANALPPAPATQPDEALPPPAPTRIQVPTVDVIARAQPDEASAEPATSESAPEAAGEEAPNTDLPAFDSEAARQSIASAEARLAVCRGPSDPTGPATVVVRYAPSGRVTTATVESGPFAGTPTGGCIAATFRSTRVPPFSGDSVTVKRTVTLR